MKILALTILWLMLTQTMVGIHFYIIEVKNKTPDHTVSFFAVFAMAAWISYRVFDTLVFMITGLCFLGLMYWIVFPLLLNMYRRKPFLHLGKDTVLDRFEAKLKSPGATLGLKVVMMIMALFVLLDL